MLIVINISNNTMLLQIMASDNFILPRKQNTNIPCTSMTIRAQIVIRAPGDNFPLTSSTISSI